mmetsp:Transcript_27161/g.69129  ORF Transcript_27161/g.69129 Transcript_27161/m.69129 type:complete len:244 (-) Transcript_27161:335-1066(-)
MESASSPLSASRPRASAPLSGPSPHTSVMPDCARRSLEEKKGRPGTTDDCTYAYSVTPFSPACARRQLSAKRAAAYAMDSVALPDPALAATTSVPASWMRAVSLAAASSGRLSAGCACDSRGRMVMPAWPPTTGTRTSRGSTPRMSAMKASARTTSSVVTPNRRRGSYTPARLNTSAAMGTVELTGLEMMATQAVGQCLAMASHRLATMPALMLNRSSRVMPGLRGTPAGMTTSWQPCRAAGS